MCGGLGGAEAGGWDLRVRGGVWGELRLCGEGGVGGSWDLGRCLGVRGCLDMGSEGIHVCGGVRRGAGRGPALPQVVEAPWTVHMRWAGTVGERSGTRARNKSCV